MIHFIFQLEPINDQRLNSISKRFRLVAKVYNPFRYNNSGKEKRCLTWIWIIQEENAYCILIWIEGVIKAMLLEEWHYLMILERLQKGNVCFSQALRDELSTKQKKGKWNLLILKFV